MTYSLRAIGRNDRRRLQENDQDTLLDLEGEQLTFQYRIEDVALLALESSSSFENTPRFYAIERRGSNLAIVGRAIIWGTQDTCVLSDFITTETGFQFRFSTNYRWELRLLAQTAPTIAAPYQWFPNATRAHEGRLRLEKVT
jgi:hypothetical protein